MPFIIPNVVLEKDEHGNYEVPNDAKELAQKIRDTRDQRFGLFDDYESAKIAATHTEVGQESIGEKGFPIIEVAVKPLKKPSNKKGTTERYLGLARDYKCYTVEPTDSNPDGEQASFEIHMVSSNHLTFGKATFTHLGEGYADREIDLSGVQINEMEVTPTPIKKRRTNRRELVEVTAEQNESFQLPQREAVADEANRDQAAPVVDPADEPPVEDAPRAAPVPSVSFLRRAFNAVFNWKNAERAAHVAAFAAGAYAFVQFGGPAYVVTLLAKAGYTALSANALLGVQLGSLALAGLAVERVGSFSARRVVSAIQNWRRPAPENELPVENTPSADAASERLQNLLTEPVVEQINVDNNENGVGAAPITHQLNNSQQPRPNRRRCYQHTGCRSFANFFLLPSLCFHSLVPHFPPLSPTA